MSETKETKKPNGKSPEDAARKSLFSKLAEILAGVTRVPKKGFNPHHKYNYVMEADLADTIRPMLAEHGIALIWSCDQVEHMPEGMVQCRIKIILSDGVDREEAVVFGIAQDKKGDKALYKAMTGATKYWLFKNFLVSTGDDPETENGDQSGAGDQEQPPDEEQQALARDWKRYQDDAQKVKNLKSREESEAFIEQNKADWQKNRYKANYSQLIADVRKRFPLPEKAA